MQAQFQLGSCIQTCTNEAHSLENLQDLIPTLGSLCCLRIFIAAKVGINLVDLLENVFHLCMHGCNYPAGIVFT